MSCIKHKYFGTISKIFFGPGVVKELNALVLGEKFAKMNMARSVYLIFLIICKRSCNKHYIARSCNQHLCLS